MSPSPLAVAYCLRCFHAPAPRPPKPSQASSLILVFSLPTKYTAPLHYTLQETEINISSTQSDHRSTYAVICNPAGAADGLLRSEGGWDRGGGGRKEELRRMPHHHHAHVARRPDRAQVSVQRLRDTVQEEEEARPWP